jgi:hypothetical protein
MEPCVPAYDVEVSRRLSDYRERVEKQVASSQ